MPNAAETQKQYNAREFYFKRIVSDFCERFEFEMYNDEIEYLCDRLGLPRNSVQGIEAGTEATTMAIRVQQPQNLRIFVLKNNAERRRQRFVDRLPESQREHHAMGDQQVDEATDDEAMDDEAMDDEAMDDEAMDDEAMDDEAVDDEVANDKAIDDKAVDDMDMVNEQAHWLQGQWDHYVLSLQESEPHIEWGSIY